MNQREGLTRDRDYVCIRRFAALAWRHRCTAWRLPAPHRLPTPAPRVAVNRCP